MEFVKQLISLFFLVMLFRALFASLRRHQVHVHLICISLLFITDIWEYRSVSLKIYLSELLLNRLKFMQGATAILAHLWRLCEPSQSQHCVRKVRLGKRNKLAQLKHMLQNVPVPERRRNQRVYQQYEEHTHTHKMEDGAYVKPDRWWMNGGWCGANRSPRLWAAHEQLVPARVLSQYLAQIGPVGPRNALVAPRPHHYLALPFLVPKIDLQAREP